MGGQSLLSPSPQSPPINADEEEEIVLIKEEGKGKQFLGLAQDEL